VNGARQPATASQRSGSPSGSGSYHSRNAPSSTWTTTDTRNAKESKPMPETVINRNLLNNPFERFLTTPVRSSPPPTPVVTLPKREAPPLPPEPMPMPWPDLPPPAELFAFKIKPTILGRANEGGALKAAELIEFVAFMAGVEVEDLLGPSRKVPVVYVRQVAMWFVYRFGGKSLPFIGRCFGRDHTTILHGVNSVKKTIRDRLIVPESETPMGWIVPVLAEHTEAGYRTAKTRGTPHRVYDCAALSAIRKQALEAYWAWQDGQDARIQGVDGRSGLGRRDGGARPGPTDWSLSPPDKGLSTDAQ
jgi:hypothetical protein